MWAGGGGWLLDLVHKSGDQKPLVAVCDCRRRQKAVGVSALRR